MFLLWLWTIYQWIGLNEARELGSRDGEVVISSHFIPCHALVHYTALS